MPFWVVSVSRRSLTNAYNKMNPEIHSQTFGLRHIPRGAPVKVHDRYGGLQESSLNCHKIVILQRRCT